MLKQESIQKLQTTKNLLAFSGGVDSSALFFLLLEANVYFDIAIVDYNTRASSKDEVSYAKFLADKYSKNIYLHSVNLEQNNFESKARKVRYAFFEKIIKDNAYDCLITAHQLNDKVEWFLMSFCKGGGLKTLTGMDEFENRNNYIISRPLLEYAKEDLLVFLQNNKIKYFEDITNFDEKYTRNYFRKNYANSLVANFKKQINISFELLGNEKKLLYPDFKIFEKEQILVTKPHSEQEMLFMLDFCLKKLGYIPSKMQKKEFLKSKNIVIGSKIVAVYDDEFLFLCPLEKLKMSKEFKEKCRKAKIPSKIRGYMFLASMTPADFRTSLVGFF